MGSKPSGISGSRAAAILGLSEYQTPFETWTRIMEDIEPGFCESTGIVPPEPVDSAPVRWGSAFEDAVIKLAEEETGVSIKDREHEFRHSEFDYVTCHVDGVYDVADPVLHEGKTTNLMTYRDKWGEPGTERIPREYQIQVQHQMLCSGIDNAVVSVLVFPTRADEWEKAGIELDSVAPDQWARMLKEMGYFYQYEIKVDLELHKTLIEAYCEFWETFVLSQTPPGPERYEDIRRLCPEPKGTVVADEYIERLSAEYNGIKKEIKITEKRKDQLKTTMLSYMRSQAETPIDDDSIESWILRSRNGRKLHSFNGKTFR